MSFDLSKQTDEQKTFYNINLLLVRIWSCVWIVRVLIQRRLDL